MSPPRDTKAAPPSTEAAAATEETTTTTTTTTTMTTPAQPHAAGYEERERNGDVGVLCCASL